MIRINCTIALVCTFNVKFQYSNLFMQVYMNPKTTFPLLKYGHLMSKLGTAFPASRPHKNGYFLVALPCVVQSATLPLPKPCRYHMPWNWELTLGPLAYLFEFCIGIQYTYFIFRYNVPQRLLIPTSTYDGIYTKYCITSVQKHSISILHTQNHSDVVLPNEI